MKKVISQQYILLKLTLSFFTRIPVNFNHEINQDMLHQASRYFGVIGMLIGVLLAAFTYVLQFYLPLNICLVLVIILNLLLTGAFHEDGLADVFDGFGGGWQVKDKLSIMKDSRLGTYAAAALFLALLLKFELLNFLSQDVSLLLCAIVVANTLSRVFATSLIFSMSYVREDESEKVKPIAKELSFFNLIFLCLTGLSVLCVFTYLGSLPVIASGMLLIALSIAYLLLRFWFNRQLKGYTGDCLGAAQVINELLIYAVLISVLLPYEGVYG